MEVDRINKEHILAGLVGGTVTLLALIAAKKYKALGAATKKTGMAHPPVYHDASALDFDHPPADPNVAFKQWFEASKIATTVPNPNAMSVATVDADGQPSVRLVLCRGFDERGVVFYTNREGRKGLALKANPVACANFHWDQLDRQIRIEGPVTHTTEEESDAYWATRNRANRINSKASQQSRPIGSRQELEEAALKVEKEFEG